MDPQHPALPEPLARELHSFALIPIASGCSAARVYRLERRGRTELFLKTSIRSSDPDPSASLRGEAERLQWMRSAGVNVPDVVAFVDDGAEWLVTTALAGHAISEMRSEADVARAVDSIASALRALHEIDIATCPFDARLESTIACAAERVARGLVDADDFDEERTGRSPEDLLDELQARRPATEDVVFTHGDCCLPNLILDVQSALVESVGFVDVGRAGIADRYQDLALVTRSLESPMNPAFGSGAAARFLSAYGIEEPDREKIECYRLLDEFF